jgi:hypothetical protein
MKLVHIHSARQPRSVEPDLVHSGVPPLIHQS